MLWLHILFIVISAISISGASGMTTQEGTLNIPLLWNTKRGMNILYSYIFTAFILAVINTYFFTNSWIQAFIVGGIGTHFGGSFFGEFLPFNYTTQFLIFGFLNIIFTIIHLVYLFAL